jgi:hypothetical protein
MATLIIKITKNEDDYDYWYEMDVNPEQNKDGNTRLEPWEFFDEDGEAATSDDWVM